MKKSVRIITLILSLLLLATSFPASAASDTKTTPDGAYEYKVFGKAVELTRYLGKEAPALNPDGSYTIPSEIDGKKVTSLGSYLFEYKDVPSATVVIPDTITYIGSHAFSYQEEVYDPVAAKNNVEYEADFEYLSKLEHITIPDSVVEIDASAFYGTPNLKEITIPDSVRYLGKYAFYRSGIKKAVIGDGISAIKSYTFGNCKNLSSVTLPESINELKEGAFWMCPSLKKLNVNYNTRLGKYCFGDKQGESYEKGKKLIYNVTRTTKKLYLNYAYKYKIPAVINIKCDKMFMHAEAGYEFTLKINGKAVTNCKSTRNNVFKVTKDGKVTVLNKGKATFITAKDSEGKTHKIYCTNSFSAPSAKKSVTVKKGKTVTIKLSGKAHSIKNTYKNTKIAKITSKRTADKLKIKGLRRGTTALRVKVNGVKILKIKVKVV